MEARYNCKTNSKVSPASWSDEAARYVESPIQLLKKPILAPQWKELQGANDWQGLLHPLDDNLRAEIVRYGELAQVCYDSFDSDPQSIYRGSCKYNKEKLFLNVGMGSCGYEVTKYLYATSNFPCVGVLCSPVTDEKWSSHSNWIGYVAVCTSPAEIQRLGRRDILVCWRGTQTSTEWAEDLRDVLECTAGALENTRISAEKEQYSSAVKVEQGFLSIYTSTVKGSMFNHCSSRDQLLQEIKGLLVLYKHDELSITLSGHSLGGALATLCAYDMAQMGINRTFNVREPEEPLAASKVVPITAFTFGCPRVGNIAFRDECRRLNVKILRVVNKNDIVPNVPGVLLNEQVGLLSRLLSCLPWAYFHVGAQLTLDNNHSPFLRSTWNPSYLHNLEAYLHLVDGYNLPKSEFLLRGRDPALVNKHTGLLVDEQRIPSSWWQDQNKGLRKNEKGMWAQREREDDDLPHKCIY